MQQEIKVNTSTLSDQRKDYASFLLTCTGKDGMKRLYDYFSSDPVMPAHTDASALLHRIVSKMHGFAIPKDDAIRDILRNHSSQMEDADAELVVQLLIRLVYAKLESDPHPVRENTWRLARYLRFHEELNDPSAPEEGDFYRININGRDLAWYMDQGTWMELFDAIGGIPMDFFDEFLTSMRSTDKATAEELVQAEPLSQRNFKHAEDYIELYRDDMICRANWMFVALAVQSERLHQMKPSLGGLFGGSTDPDLGLAGIIMRMSGMDVSLVADEHNRVSFTPAKIRYMSPRFCPIQKKDIRVVNKPGLRTAKFFKTLVKWNDKVSVDLIVRLVKQRAFFDANPAAEAAAWAKVAESVAANEKKTHLGKRRAGEMTWTDTANDEVMSPVAASDTD
jgi:hypothetical protein